MSATQRRRRSPSSASPASTRSSRREGGGTTTALQGIDLDIRAGEFVSLIGPSGCGKSTLLRVIGDLIQPTARRA